eukprot:TRINITY_DN3133_c0_g1_i1.p1 TRINITY_DN3133_c0_g1~~TRINITY_DN3133_c0_g1_i1.p1  ORF type:complete len:1072 (+),score=121.07 TRINITY_DN3133_c0_g1_i1:257-3472(+)
MQGPSVMGGRRVRVSFATIPRIYAHGSAPHSQSMQIEKVKLGTLSCLQGNEFDVDGELDLPANLEFNHVKRRIEITWDKKNQNPFGFEGYLLEEIGMKTSYSLYMRYKGIWDVISVYADGPNYVLRISCKQAPSIVVHQISPLFYSIDEDSRVFSPKLSQEQDEDKDQFSQFFKKFSEHLTVLLFIPRQQTNDPMKSLAKVLKEYRLEMKEDTHSWNLVHCEQSLNSYTLSKLPVDIEFQIESLRSCRFLLRRDLSKFYDKVSQDLCKNSESQVTAALQGMWSPGHMHYYYADPYTAFDENLRIAQTTVEIPGLVNRLVPIKRVVITPLCVYCIGPMLEESNRVLRMFPGEENKFLRVSFSSEGLDQINGLHQDPNGPLVQRIKDVLDKGLKIGRIRYHFLAFSSSQLRENDCWFVSEEKSVEEIHTKLGSFQDIKIVGKHAARIGQCFSTTQNSIEIPPQNRKIIPDIFDNQGRLFTDGVGQISVEAATRVAEKMKLNSVPSVFQIRYGGFKGTLAVNPKLVDKDIALRKSMDKFPCDHMDLEICSYTKPLCAFLNRQIIMLLNGLGVPDEVFLDMQKTFLKYLEKMMVNSAAAQRILGLYGGQYRFVKKLLEAEIPVEEPFVQAQLAMLRECAVKDLRRKAKLPVEHGRLLMGVVDETQTLEYGQVFIQISKSSPYEWGFLRGENERVITDPVMVAKNPCLHPGDCRRLNAVDVTELHHLVDCIVFPSKGKRPHPNECSGSDLDGDLYFATWDPRFLIPKNADPSDYSAPVPMIGTGEQSSVSVADIKEFFVNFMITESLGRIANAHLVFADKKGIFCAECIELSELHSQAVDFPKTGIAVPYPRELRVSEYPDFMNKKNAVRYESQRVLGKMYRHLTKSLKGKELHHYVSYNNRKATVLRQFLKFHDYKSYVDAGIEHRREYNVELSALMNQYGVKWEAEIITGDVLKFNWYKKKRSYFSMKQSILDAFSELRQRHEARFWEEFQEGLKAFEYGKSPTNSEVPWKTEKDLIYAICSKASAYYQVTYLDKYYHDDWEQEYFISFPWVTAWSCILGIPKIESICLRDLKK